MGELESRHLHLHSLLGHSPWDGNTYQQSQVSRLGFMDGRAIAKRIDVGEYTSEQVLGGQARPWTRALRSQDGELHTDEI
jgi:hypothetical protein